MNGRKANRKMGLNRTREPEKRPHEKPEVSSNRNRSLKNPLLDHKHENKNYLDMYFLDAVRILAKEKTVSTLQAFVLKDFIVNFTG